MSASGVDRLAARLLRRHVADGAEDQARLGARGRSSPPSTVVGLQARQAEIEQLDVAVGPDHHVVRLDVAVDDLRGVRDRQRFGDLPRDADGAFERQALRRQLPQRRALDELHRDVAIGVDDAGLVDGDDVGVVERRGERRLAQQPIERVVLRIGPDGETRRMTLSAMSRPRRGSWRDTPRPCRRRQAAR